MGMMKFTNEYPYKAPSLLMVSETGRFEVDQKIQLCALLPNAWQPTWTINDIMRELIAFMLSGCHTSGAILNGSNENRSRIARNSRAKLAVNPMFQRVFALYRTVNPRLDEIPLKPIAQRNLEAHRVIILNAQGAAFGQQG